MKKNILAGIIVAAMMVGTSSMAFAESKVVEPLPADTDLTAMEDCTFAASFSDTDVYSNKTGTAVVCMTVYSPEYFDLADVSTLAEGDTIVIGGESIAITSLSTDDYGCVLVNGGLDEDGYTLATTDNTVYYVQDYDDAMLYTELGDTFLTVDANFVMTDNSDLENPDQKLALKDFLDYMAANEWSCGPQNASVTVAGGVVTDITVQYMP